VEERISANIGFLMALVFSVWAFTKAAPDTLLPRFQVQLHDALGDPWRHQQRVDRLLAVIDGPFANPPKTSIISVHLTWLPATSAFLLPPPRRDKIPRFRTIAATRLQRPAVHLL
jgi:hypothetical protein